jgi:hypothetical protein
MRRIIYFIVAVVTFTVGVVVASLRVIPHFWPVDKSNIQTTSRMVVPAISPAESQPSPMPNSPIRSADFANFTYPIIADLKVFGSRRKTFTLKNGEFPETKDAVGMFLPKGTTPVSYGDVTGDGDEEALVRIGVDTNGGTASISCIYVYAWRNNMPELLWSFVGGDRADGGLRSAYAESGGLVVELKGKDKIIGTDLYADDGTSSGACCPTFFTRTRYQWNGKGFKQIGKAEVLPIR